MILNLRVFWLLCAAFLTFASARGESSRFELRGIMDLGSGPSFSVFNTETGSSFWIRLGRQIGSIEASAYDPAEGILTLQEGSATHRLRLADASDQPMLVMTDQLVAQTKAAEERRIAAPTRNPRLRSLIVERRRQGIIEPIAAASGRTPSLLAPGSRAGAASDNDATTTDPSPATSPAQASKPAPSPYPELPEGMRYNGGPEDRNPRILSKNEIPYPSLPR